jgi:hypothetical protein
MGAAQLSRLKGEGKIRQHGLSERGAVDRREQIRSASGVW